MERPALQSQFCQKIRKRRNSANHIRDVDLDVRKALRMQRLPVFDAGYGGVCRPYRGRVDLDATIAKVDDPIFGYAVQGVSPELGVVIANERRIGNFDDQVSLARMSGRIVCARYSTIDLGRARPPRVFPAPRRRRLEGIGPTAIQGGASSTARDWPRATGETRHFTGVGTRFAANQSLTHRARRANSATRV